MDLVAVVALAVGTVAEPVAEYGTAGSSVHLDYSSQSNARLLKDSQAGSTCLLWLLVACTARHGRREYSPDFCMYYTYPQVLHIFIMDMCST